MSKLILLLPLMIGCFSLSAQEFYRWTDANGQLHISQNPPTKAVQYEVVTLQELSKQQLHKPKAAETTKQATTSSTTSQQPAALDQQVEQLNKQAEQLQQQLDAQRCQTAQRNKASLQRQAPVFTTDADGQQTFLDDEQRAVQLEVAEEEISRFCQPTP